MHRLVKDRQPDIVSLQTSSESEINKILLRCLPDIPIAWKGVFFFMHT